MTAAGGGSGKRARTAAAVGVGGAVIGVAAMLHGQGAPETRPHKREEPQAQPRAKLQPKPPLPHFGPLAAPASARKARRKSLPDQIAQMPPSHRAQRLIPRSAIETPRSAGLLPGEQVRNEFAAAPPEAIAGPAHPPEPAPEPAITPAPTEEAVPPLVQEVSKPAEIAAAAAPGPVPTADPVPTQGLPTPQLDRVPASAANDIPLPAARPEAPDPQGAAAADIAPVGVAQSPATLQAPHNPVAPTVAIGDRPARAPAPAMTTAAPTPAAAPQTSPARQARPVQLALATPVLHRAPLPQPAFGKAARAPAPLSPQTGQAPPTALAATRLPVPAFGIDPATPPPSGETAALTHSGKVMAAGFVPATFSPDDELILEVSTGQGQGGDTMTAYGNRSGVYLPLGELARLLDLAITVSDEGQYASGWVLDEKHTVSISLREGRILRDGQDIALSPRDAVAFDGEMYVRADRFADLMPLTIKVDLRSQTVAIKTLVPFPFEQRLEREMARNRLTNRGGNEDHKYPREQTPWRALSVPIGEVELRAISDSPRGARTEGDLRLAGDLALMTARAFASVSSREGLTAARVELGRRDPDARLLGPLKATEFQLGDVATGSLSMGLRGVGGRGAMITNAPVERLSVFDKIDLRGDLPAGYEAELYRNNTLVGSTRAAAKGQYEFLQVPLEFGLNVFRTVLYGPQGQRQEDVRRISVGDASLARHELVYSFGIAQKDISVFDVHGDNFSPSQDYGAWRTTAEVQYGVATALTAKLGGALYESMGSRHWLVTTGLRTSLAGLATKLDFGLQDGSGTGISAALGGRTAGIDWTATHAEYSGVFTDEVRAFNSDPLRRATEIVMNGALHLGTAARPFVLPLAARVRRIAYADGRVQTDASLRGSALVAPFLVSNSLTLGRLSSPGERPTTLVSGTFDLATVSGSRTQYRASLDYDVAPRLRLGAISAEVNRSLGEDTLVRISAGYVLAGGQTQLGLSAAHRFRNLSLALDATASVPQRVYAATLRLGFSFGRNPLSGRMFLARPGLAGSGAIAVRAFRDANGNRRFDRGEEPVRDVEFDTGILTGKTDRQGVALIGGVGDGTRSSVHVNDDTLPDIAMAPARAGVEIVPRAGRIHVSEFAIETLSDIEGTALFGASGRAVAGVLLQLIDVRGKEVAHVRTASGGSFYFEQVHPGEYALQLDPGQARRLHIRLVDMQPVRIGADGGTTRLTVRVESAAP